MNSYELLVLIRPDLTEEGRNGTVKRVEDWVKNAGGEIVESKDLGVRKLAYPIKKTDEAVYHFYLVDAPAGMPAELAAKIRIDEEILRHLLINRHPLAGNEITTWVEE